MRYSRQQARPQLRKRILQDRTALAGPPLPQYDKHHSERNAFQTLLALVYLKECDLPALRSVQIDGNEFEPSQEYKVKKMMEEFRSVTQYRNYHKIHIHV